MTEGRIAGTERTRFDAICNLARVYRERGVEVEVRFAKGVRPGLPIYVLHWAEPREVQRADRDRMGDPRPGGGSVAGLQASRRINAPPGRH